MSAPAAKGASKVQANPKNTKAARVGGSDNSITYNDL